MAEHGLTCDPPPTPGEIRCNTQFFLTGSPFSVRRAREAARALLPLAEEQSVFEDWTRARGMGPENREPGAFALDEWFYFSPKFRWSAVDGGWAVAESPVTVDGVEFFPAVTLADAGGWPGKLASEWSRERCPNRCEPTPEAAADDTERWHGPDDSVCERGWVPSGRDRRAPMGRSLARLGRRVLEALEGQPDECEACDGEGWWVIGGLDGSPPEREGCPDCHGTGDNLRGELPKVVETRQERERGTMRAAREAGHFTSLDAWSGLVSHPSIPSAGGVTWSTRSVDEIVSDFAAMAHARRPDDV